MITQYLVEHSNGLLKIIPEVADWTGKEYSMFDDGGVEVEVGEFLYGFIKMLKPFNVLTTGVYTGISDMYIAQALIDNKKGKITALEFEKYHLDRARSLWNAVGVSQVIEGVYTSSLNYTPEEQYKFIFLDTEPGLRFQEMIKFYPYLDKGGYLLIHDINGHMSG